MPKYERPERGSAEWTVGQEINLVQTGIHKARQAIKQLRDSRHARSYSDEELWMRTDQWETHNADRKYLHARNHELVKMPTFRPLHEHDPEYRAEFEFDEQALPPGESPTQD